MNCARNKKLFIICEVLIHPRNKLMKSKNKMQCLSFELLVWGLIQVNFAQKQQVIQLKMCTNCVKYGNTAAVCLCYNSVQETNNLVLMCTWIYNPIEESNEFVSALVYWYIPVHQHLEKRYDIFKIALWWCLWHADLTASHICKNANIAQHINWTTAVGCP